MLPRDRAGMASSPGQVSERVSRAALETVAEWSEDHGEENPFHLMDTVAGLVRACPMVTSLGTEIGGSSAQIDFWGSLGPKYIQSLVSQGEWNPADPVGSWTPWFRPHPPHKPL